ncbi:MAG: tetratricopeptide repeat protein, partial [Deltaproteobacteria bacterium]|nr:tetratricopeptide repeat protein [Deltaproteobacteria bacterium]
MNKYRVPAIFALIMLSLAPFGCGPGFPIMTAEQESLSTNVDRLVKESAEMKTRLSALEGGAANRDTEDLRKAVAETASSVEQLRQDFSIVRGSLEEADHEKGQVKEDVKSASASLKSINERLKEIEGAVKENDGKISGIRSSVDAMEKKVSSIEESVASLEKKTAGLEARAAEPKNADEAGKSAIDPDSLYLRGYTETKDKEYEKAALSFQKFLAEFPGHKLADHAQYWLGEAYYARGDWERAILEFDKVIKKYPGGGKAAAATLKEGLSFEKL